MTPTQHYTLLTNLKQAVQTAEGVLFAALVAAHQDIGGGTGRPHYGTTLLALERLCAGASPTAPARGVPW